MSEPAKNKQTNKQKTNQKKTKKQKKKKKKNGFLSLLVEQSLRPYYIIYRIVIICTFEQLRST